MADSLLSMSPLVSPLVRSHSSYRVIISLDCPSKWKRSPVDRANVSFDFLGSPFIRYLTRRRWRRPGIWRFHLNTEVASTRIKGNSILARMLVWYGRERVFRLPVRFTTASETQIQMTMLTVTAMGKGAQRGPARLKIRPRHVAKQACHFGLASFSRSCRS